MIMRIEKRRRLMITNMMKYKQEWIFMRDRKEE